MAFGGDDSLKVSHFGEQKIEEETDVPTGYLGGRLATLKDAITLQEAVSKVKAHFNLSQGSFLLHLPDPPRY